MTSLPMPNSAWTGRSRHAGILALLSLLSVVAVIASLGVGASAISPGTVLRTLLHTADASPRDAAIVLHLRLPRTLLGFGLGAALAVSGAVMQGLFRNPLADPGLIGVSAGGAMAAVAGTVGLLALPLAAFAGSLCTTLAIQRLASDDGRTDVSTLLLAGIAINAIAGAVTGFLIFGSDDRQLRDITFWSMGSLGGATWTTVLGLAPFALGAVFAAGRWAGVLDALLLGEREAGLLGFDVEPAKRRIVIATAAAVGAGVAAAGVSGFVGLVVPHLVRLMAGAGHRLLLPASALLGGTLMLCADMLARTVVIPAELPIGLVTALLGGPFFLWLLIRQRRSFPP